MLKKKLALTIGAALLLGAAGTLQAADTDTDTTTTSSTATSGPMSQGLNSVDKNLAKDPDNKGLQTAQERLIRNRAEKTERLERVERAERVERPEVERPEREGRD